MTVRPFPCWMALVCATQITAQAGPDRRTARIGCVTEAMAPRIDGHLTDACWLDAPAIGELTMVEPWLGREPSRRTVVKLLHDRHHLYLGLWCFDADTATIRASQRARDARLDPDDRVEIMLDPFENRRTGYFFQIGAGGSIGDILIAQNGGRFDKPWDAIWSGAARITGDGWLAEIAIPFRSIPRREGARSWGFNLKRFARTANEEYQWANPSQAVPFYRVSECGTIEGFGEIDGGIGLEVVPYVAASVVRDRRASDDDWRVDPDAGGEIWYRPSPSVTLATTLFTDFAETEDDSRQINLNRFPLFFPEKRDFFLAGSSYFDFGAGDAGNSQFLPFFSRRIGLAGDGSKIPLLFGAKLTGEAGPFELGLLDVQADDTAFVGEENLAIVRCKYAVDEQTTFGVIGTHGDPTGAGSNSVAGVDFYHRQPNFLGDLDLITTIDLVGSTGSAGDDDGESFGIDLRARGSEWTFGAGTRQVAASFQPAIGFVPRRDTRQSSLQATWEPRSAEGGALRRYQVDLDVERADSVGGDPQRSRFGIQPGLELHSGDGFGVFVRREFERIDQDFTLFRGSTTVFAGDYWSTRAGLYAQSTEGRPWNGYCIVSTGDFFDGRSDQLEGSVDWRTSPLLHLGIGYDTAIVDLGPGRAFTTQIGSARFDLYFSPAVSLRTLVQFDNESNEIGWQSRLRWIYAPGCDFFAVLGSAWQREPDDSIVPTEQALEFKLAHSLRF